MKILGLESSCDETAAATFLRKNPHPAALFNHNLLTFFQKCDIMKEYSSKELYGT